MSFKPYKTDRSDFNAGNIAVIEVAEKQSNSTVKKKKNKQHISSKHKSCNADKIIRPDKEFKKFIKKFMEEKETTTNDNTKHEGS